MIRQTGEGDTKGGIIIPKNNFKEFVKFQKGWVKRKMNYRRCIINRKNFEVIGGEECKLL